MSSFFKRIRKSQTRRLPLQVLFATTPLLAPLAHAQVTTAVVATPALPQEPVLTGQNHPSSSISSSQRVLLTAPRVGAKMGLLMTVPDSASNAGSDDSNPVLSLPAPVLTVTPQTVASLPKPEAATSSRSISTLGAILGAKALSKPVVIKTSIAESPAVHVEPTRLAANLPARGGPVLSTSPGSLEVVPQVQTADAPPVSDSDKQVLAQLDSDLAKAQKRLDRAETRLTDGQRQLGAFTGVLQSAMLDAGDDARGLHPFVRVAQRYLGTPYVWGGESARGFDCSGFIMRVMRDLGYKALPHSAAEQFHYGTPIAKPLLKPGDVVFFANTYKPGISHVGIYLGKGRFIHAANSHVGTIVSSLNEPKWVEKYAGARRLIPLNS